MAGESEIPDMGRAARPRRARRWPRRGSPAPREEAVELLSRLLGVPGSELLAQLASPMRQSDAETYAAGSRAGQQARR